MVAARAAYRRSLDIIERLTKANVFAEVGARASAKPTLIIRGRFMDYDPGSSAVRAVYGTDPTLTAQIELVDAQTNKTIGVLSWNAV
jgi:hypothetical protein